MVGFCDHCNEQLCGNVFILKRLRGSEERRCFVEVVRSACLGNNKFHSLDKDFQLGPRCGDSRSLWGPAVLTKCIHTD